MAYWIDDGFDTWPQAFQAGTAAIGLYARCGAWSARNATDGIIPAELATAYGTREWTQKLVAAGLWEAQEAGYRDVFFHQHGNPTSEVSRLRRTQAAKRQALVRDPALRDAVRQRDEDRCRYCGVAVRWSDRRGGRGGTYDHIDPTGPNTYDNLVVCCRSCNSRKRQQTPEQAGMALRPLPNQRPRSDLDTTQNEPRTNLVSSQPPALPPPKGGKGAGAREAGTGRPAPVDNRSSAPICPRCGNRTNTPYHRRNCTRTQPEDP